MKFLGFMFFEKDSVDQYPGVLVPLAQASRHPTVAAEYARRRSADGRNEDGSRAEKKTEVKGSEGDTEDGVLRTSSAGYDPYTIEGLRAEVMEDASPGGHDTAYDCEYVMMVRVCGG